MKILLIEDELALASSITDYLEPEGYLCETAADHFSATEKISLYEYDCVLADITLPGGSGLDLVRLLRQKQSKTGIIIISAKNAVDDKIAGLDLGADDYLAKPFNLAELHSRIKSVIRRRSFAGEQELVFNEISIQPEAKTAAVNGQPLTMTRKEYDLLLFFVTNKNRVLTREIIAEHLWGDAMDMADSFDFIYTHIKNLRRKLVEKGAADYIKTVYGMGYKFGAA